MLQTTRWTNARRAAVGLTAASMLFLGACSSGSSAKTSDSTGSTPPTTASSPTSGGDGGSASSSSGGGGASSSKPTGKPLEKFRVGNFYTAKGGGAGPSLDVYEYQSVYGNVPQVLLKDVAYGTISKYVDPPTYADTTGSRGFQLGVVKAGAKVKASTDLTGLGGAGSNPPEYYQQETILLTTDLNDQSQPGDDALPGMQSGPYVEKPGPKQEGSDQITLPKKSSGGQLLFRDATDPSQSTTRFLQIDGACPKAVDDTSSNDGVPTLFTVYDVSPGSHQLTMGIDGDSSGMAPASCDAIVKVGEGTVDAAAGSQVLVVYYSSDGAKTIKFASAPIDG